MLHRPINVKAVEVLALCSLLTVVLLLSTTSMVQAATELSIPPTVSVGSHPEYAAYDSAKGKIFVTNQGDGTV